jgi:microsomal epoxide hydrolase
MKRLRLLLVVVLGLVPRLGYADADIRPFTINVPEDEITDLDNRLSRIRWPQQLPGTTWEHGADIATLATIAEYWRDDYDWRAAEAALNVYPQFLTDVDGTQLHFVHSESSEEGALPLILLHGWPGSFFEFSDLIEPLNQGDQDMPAFDVVVPSLPGFGFSGPTLEADWDTRRMAEAMFELMDRLGYDRFYAHGTDFGSLVAQWMARLAPERVIGLHSNFIVSMPPSPEAMQSLSPEEMQRFTSFQQNEMGYFILQETKPQTIAYALNDSPVGLLAWHGEKFQSWTDHDGSFLSAVDIDTFLTNLSIYWFTETSGSSARLYRAGLLAGGNFAPQPQFDTPIGHAVFPAEVIASPERWNDLAYNIVHRTEFESGGHHPAWEQPEALVRDIRDFVIFMEAQNE